VVPLIFNAIFVYTRRLYIYSGLVGQTMLLGNPSC